MRIGFMSLSWGLPMVSPSNEGISSTPSKIHPFPEYRSSRGTDPKHWGGPHPSGPRVVQFSFHSSSGAIKNVLPLSSSWSHQNYGRFLIVLLQWFSRILSNLRKMSPSDLATLQPSTLEWDMKALLDPEHPTLNNGEPCSDLGIGKCYAY